LVETPRKPAALPKVPGCLTFTAMNGRSDPGDSRLSGTSVDRSLAFALADREKQETFAPCLCCTSDPLSGSSSMVEDAPLRTVVARTWAVYVATHRDVDAADSRRCLLERHLQRKWKNSDAEGLVCSGLAYLRRTTKDEW
jgi:hypothetical protein